MPSRLNSSEANMPPKMMEIYACAWGRISAGVRSSSSSGPHSATAAGVISRVASPVSRMAHP